MIRVTHIERRTEDSTVVLRGRVDSEAGPLDDFAVWWRYPAGYADHISRTSNAFLAALLLPAMRLGEDLHVEGRICRSLMEHLSSYMEIVSRWWPQAFRPIRITAEECTETPEGGALTGTFFSGGVDSFYTLLKQNEAISHLIFIHGFDILLSQDALYAAALKGIENTAKALDKKVIAVSTNLIDLKYIVNWNHYNGPALISAALGLGGAFRKVFVPASFYEKDLFPWGSHPLTDPLWSTDSLDIVHDGCEANRIEKIRRQIAGSRTALDNLRVCTVRHPTKTNCCVCEKCVRTMLNLKIAGVLDRCGAFRRKFTYSDLRNLNLSGDAGKIFAQENYEAMTAAGLDRRMIRAFRFSMERGLRWKVRHGVRKALHQMKKNIQKHLLRRAPGRPEGKPETAKIVLKKPG